MKKIIICFLALFVLTSTPLWSQHDSDSTYHHRLFYTCKVWGYVKSFHSAMVDCSIDWDSVLIATLPLVHTANTNQDFNDILLDMAMAPGEMAFPSVPPPVVPDSLILNLDTDWFNDTVIYDPLRTILDTIKARHRLQDNCYITSFPLGNPDFTQDNGYGQAGSYPDLEVRLLAMFRYWNDIEYYFPYADVMDQDWDTTFLEIIPWFINATNSTDYSLAIIRLVHHINDTHGFTYSVPANQFFGSAYPKFFPMQADGKMVVAYVDESLTDIHPGDVILQMDGLSINALKDSIRPFMAASNESRMQQNLNNTLARGDYGEFELLLQNENGTQFVNTLREWNSGSYYQLSENTGPIWYDTVLTGGCHYGYVDLGRLPSTSVGDMFNDFWETDAIVFDLRTYPQGTLWYIVNYLYTEPLYIANFSIPNHEYPGTITWHHEVIGSVNQDVYQGYVIILFNSNTLSQAEYTCMGLDQHPKSIKIGSQTAGADGNVSLISLPGSVSSLITGLGTFYPDYTPTQRIGIVPDYEVLRSVQGLREQRDDVLEFAFNCNLTGVIYEEINHADPLRVYPNPASGILTIEQSLEGNCKVEIIDSSGKVLFLDETDKNIYTCSVENFNSGIYLIRISNLLHTHTAKLLVK